MTDLQTDRMHLLKTLDRYLATGLLDQMAAGNRVVSCRPLCWDLWHDNSLFAPNFSSWITDICGVEAESWWRLGGTWSAAARVAAYFIDNAVVGEHGRPVRPQGLWVSEALRKPRPAYEWTVCAMGEREVDHAE